jgi:TonB-linked SusC/RagA family outer membrane protein
MKNKIVHINPLNSEYMAKYIQHLKICIVLIISVLCCFEKLNAQEAYTITGKVLESGTSKTIEQAIISETSTNTFVNSGSDGSFNIKVASTNIKLIVTYPGYYVSEFYTNGKTELMIYITPLDYYSKDEQSSSILDNLTLRNSTSAKTILNRFSFMHSSSCTPDQLLVGKVAGLNIIEQSGMSGHKSWINLRGISSIVSRNEPLVIVDGMIEETSFPNNHLVEGMAYNPYEIVDVDDIVDFTVDKTGTSFLGGAGSNGTIYINTEQKKETSASIIVKMYTGVAAPPSPLKVLTADGFKNYYNSMINNEGFSADEINTLTEWQKEGVRYQQNTNWQKELFRPAAFQKYHIFIKGGDDIATYNISTGYTRHGGPYENWRYSRFNLRLNGKINISKNLSLLPNTKLSLSDSYVSNMGPTVELNPVTSALLKSPLMTAHELSSNGNELYPLDDVGAFNVSNPAVLATEALGYGRNFQLLSSAKFIYKINSKLSVSNLTGVNVNNDRVNIFIPHIGVVRIDSAKNSPQDMLTEYRSTQNHTTVSYISSYNNVHHISANAGLRYMINTYKYSQAIDLNTASDDYKSLGQGDEAFKYLETSNGEVYSTKWLSYFADMNYSYYDKYYLSFSGSLDASSVLNRNNRFNFYPSVLGAWRLSSEDFLNSHPWINDLKLRASFSQTGNIYSTIYNFSKLTYIGKRFDNVSVPVLDYLTNSDLQAERKSTINTGFDFSFAKNAYNLHLDYYISFVTNLIINQQLPFYFGFPDYYNNGGKLKSTGIELAGDAKIDLTKGQLIVEVAIAHQRTKITELNFINPETDFLVKEIKNRDGNVIMEYVGMIDNPTNAFYGYVTRGVYNSDAEANGILGPNGQPMGAGDVIFADLDGNNIINEKDKQIIGNPNPDLFGSVSLSYLVGKFEFSTLFTYSIGNDMFNYVRYQMTAMQNFGNQSVNVNNRWVSSGNTGATIPRSSLGDPNGNNAFSDRWIEDGSYLRFKQLKVCYNSPNFFKFQKKTTVYLTGTNLLTFTKYTGYDPETMYMNSPYYLGIDFGKVPQSRSVILGIQISL